jgi:hypothetical protein
MSDEITLRAIVPAEPGWAVVRFIEGADDSRCLWYYPIIAWDIERGDHCLRGGGEKFVSHTVLPLTVDGGNIDNYGSLQAFKRPDGTFETFEGGCCKTEADLIESFKEQHAEILRERADARQKQVAKNGDT